MWGTEEKGVPSGGVGSGKFDDTFLCERQGKVAVDFFLGEGNKFFVCESSEFFHLKPPLFLGLYNY